MIKHTEKFKKDNIKLKISTDPKEIFDLLKNWKPDIVGISNYIWNSYLANLICKQAKKIKSNTLCILGGPEFPAGTGQRKIENTSLDKTYDKCLKYLIDRPSVDYFVWTDESCKICNQDYYADEEKQGVPYTEAELVEKIMESAVRPRDKEVHPSLVKHHGTTDKTWTFGRDVKSAMMDWCAKRANITKFTEDNYEQSIHKALDIIAQEKGIDPAKLGFFLLEGGLEGIATKEIMGVSRFNGKQEKKLAHW